MNGARGAGEVQPGMGPVPVLMYHAVSTGRAARQFAAFVLDPSEFAAQMDYLEAGGYSPLTTADLSARRLSGEPLPPRPVVLTFDDAYTDFHSASLPVLKKHGFPATIYVPTAYVGATASWMRSIGEGDRAILSWRALRDIAAEGIEVAAHSHTHPQLDRVPAQAAREEARRCRSLLEDNIGVPVEGFAYPFGYWNRAARAAVEAAGFRYACAVGELMTSPADDLLALPRLTVRAGSGVAGLARLLSAWPTPVRRRVSAAKKIIFRALREVPAVGGDPREGSLA